MLGQLCQQTKELLPLLLDPRSGGISRNRIRSREGLPRAGDRPHIPKATTEGAEIVYSDEEAEEGIVANN